MWILPLLVDRVGAKGIMDSFDVDPFEPSSSRDEKREAVHNLLEEGWFYGKLLNSRPKLFRCYSDPSPNSGQETLAKNLRTAKSSPIRKATCSLIRAPSLPPCTRREKKFEEKEISCGMSKLTRQFSDASKVQKPSEPTCSVKKRGGIQEKVRQARGDKKNTGQSLRHNLLRTPSLSPCLGTEFEDDDSDITMSRLIREAMPNSLPVQPRHRASKCIIQDSSMAKSRAARKSDLDIINTDSCKESRQYPTRANSMKSPRDVEFKELQGFRDLGFAFETEDLNPSVIDQERLRRPYLSEAWQVQSCDPPIPIWAARFLGQHNLGKGLLTHIKRHNKKMLCAFMLFSIR